MNDQIARSQLAVVKHWGPIEELLKLWTPQLEGTYARIMALARLGAEYGLLKRLKQLNGARNSCMHAPYSPLWDVAEFEDMAAQSLHELRGCLADSRFGQSSALLAKLEQLDQLDWHETLEGFIESSKSCPDCGSPVRFQSERFARGGGHEVWGSTEWICTNYQCMWGDTEHE